MTVPALHSRWCLHLSLGRFLPGATTQGCEDGYNRTYSCYSLQFDNSFTLSIRDCLAFRIRQTLWKNYNPTPEWEHPTTHHSIGFTFYLLRRL